MKPLIENWIREAQREYADLCGVEVDSLAPARLNFIAETIRRTVARTKEAVMVEERNIEIDLNAANAEIIGTRNTWNDCRKEVAAKFEKIMNNPD